MKPKSNPDNETTSQQDNLITRQPENLQTHSSYPEISTTKKNHALQNIYLLIKQGDSY